MPLAERVIVLDADDGRKLDELSPPAASSPVISFEGDALEWERIDPFTRSVADAFGTVEQGPDGLRVLDGDGRAQWSVPGYCRVGALAPDVVAVLELRPAMHADYEELQLRSRRDSSVIASLGPTWPEVAIARDVVYHCPLGEAGLVAWRLDGTRLWALSGPEMNMPPNCDATMAASDAWRATRELRWTVPREQGGHRGHLSPRGW